MMGKQTMGSTSNKHFASVPTPPGADDLFSLIAFLKDKSAVEKQFNRLETLRKEINSEIAVIGKVKHIESLKNDAEIEKAGALEALTKAEEEAKGIRVDAAQKAQKILEEATDEAQSINRERKEFEQFAAGKAKELHGIETDIKKREANLKGREARLGAMEAALKKDKEEIDRKKKLMAELLNASS